MAMAASREDRAYAAAVASFQMEMWSKAETAFAQFVQKYPQSTNAPMAVLLQAQAQFNEGKFRETVALLANRRGQADGLADQYVLWTGEAQFADGKFAAAADTFTSLMDNFAESPLRLQATVEAAAAHGQLQEWSQLSALLEATNGVFARKAEQDAGNELVARGQLLLAQARFAQKDYAGASVLLQGLNPQALKPELDWQRAYLLCHTKLAAGELDAALAAALNLKQIAQLEKNDQQRAEGVVLQADILEKLGRAGDAMTAYQENFTPGTPDDKQRESILKYADLAAGLKQFSVAGQALDNFLKQFPDSPPTDSAMLASGELLLKGRDLPGATNNLASARAKFDLLLTRYPNSPLAGKALLDRGWCEWLAGKIPESLADFEAATRKKLSPEDLAVAKFKAGDVLFAQKDFKGALEHYRQVYPGAVLDGAGGQPSAERELGGRAMYQSLRACLELGDAAGAADAFAKIFQVFSGEELGQDSALLYGESLVKPADARALFEKLAPNFSGSPLEPQLKLAVARTYEQEQDWTAAITNYEGWMRDCPTNNLRPQVDYALALANFQAGNEEAALAQFTHFVAQNPANALAPQAQWWVADHYFRLGGTNCLEAEKNYENIFQNTNATWKSSPLFYPAQLMAGRSAMGRAGYKDAVNYFTQLFSDTNCPDDYLKVKARFACGTARMQMDSSDTNAIFINLQTATNLFSQVVQLYPTNELGARAWGEIGDCALQLGDYVSATNAYMQVFGANSMAVISARSRAEVGCGLVLEKMADQTSGIDKTNLLNLALDDYLDVFYASNRRDGEVPAAFWVAKAGWQAAPLVRTLFDLRRQKIFYLSLQTNLPPLAEAIQKKIDALPPE